MATGVNYWSAYEPTYKVRESVWGGAELDSSSEEGGGGVTWVTPTMEVRGQLITATDTGPDRKQKNAQRLVELQERRRGLQTMLSTRLAELRRVCLQEAELTGLIPEDFPLEEGEKPPSVRRRGGSRLNRRNRTELEEKKKKTLFSSVRKHSEPEHIPHLQSQRSKRTVHRGCHTDESVRSESSSTSDSTGHDNDESVSHCRPPMVTAGSSPVEVFSQNKTRNNSVHSRSDSQDVPQKHSPPHPPPPPPRSLDGSTSSGQTEPEQLGRTGGSSTSNGGRANGANRSVANGPVGGANLSRRSNCSDGLLDRGASTEADGHWVNGLTSSKGGAMRSSETDTRTLKTTNGSEPSTRTEPGHRPDLGPRPDPGQRGRAPYSDLLLDYVWTKQQQMLQRQQSHGSRQPITALYPNQQSVLAPPTYRGLHSERQRIKVTRTKSCGPFLPVQPPGAENFDSQHGPLQPDPHPHLLPPRPTQAALTQDQHNEEATRNLHKALALEGLRDWYLRNTLGSSHPNPTNGNAAPKTNGVKGRRRTTHSVIHRSNYQDHSNYQDSNSHNVTMHHSNYQDHSNYLESNSHNAPLSNFKDINHNGTIKKSGLPHSATFHGLSLHSSGCSTLQ
ncbi:coiled-coil domain-containing protein 120 isoform X2 [Periophthalmus magnuspinnatus]|uniref:coiled-coil domain-containing protein 120 isoform X2 n=1 Tax=Periophthalmus magnuspinnatus TaxID=409849 RepID=UPI00243735A5|nr:coiled-coil domain-containing protein 120 isoform X2 [Periophthalmus magnuspinnatus]